MAASLPFGANAKEDAKADAKAEAPPEKPKPKQYGPFDAPIRKADQSAIGVSTVPLPTKGKGTHAMPDAMMRPQSHGTACCRIIYACRVCGPHDAAMAHDQPPWPIGHAREGRSSTLPTSRPKRECGVASAGIWYLEVTCSGAASRLGDWQSATAQRVYCACESCLWTRSGS